jgi:hypothetical protein
MDRRTRPEQEHLPLGRCRIKILGDLEPVRALLPIRFIPETTNSAGFGRTPGPDGSAGHRHRPGDTAGYHPVSRESTHCSGNLARGIGAQSDREISPPIGRVLQDGTELAQGLDC